MLLTKFKVKINSNSKAVAIKDYFHIKLKHSYD